MSHFQQSLIIAACPAAVYAALTTAEGLRSWWTQDCDVDTQVGGSLHFRFGRNHKAMRIEKLEPDSFIQWLCSEAQIATAGLTRQDEWIGTRLVFRLTPEGKDHTRLDFEHIGLMPALECYDLCRKGWQYFLNSLQQFLETGCGTPYELTATPGSCASHQENQQQGASPA